MERKDRLLELGDLVRITEGTHQESMPECRTGLVPYDRDWETIVL